MDARQESVLVAEEDGDLREIITGYLEAKGFRVIAVRNGADTLARIWRETVNTVVLDVRSPGSIAFRTLRELREQLPALPVIVIASFGDAFVSRQARALGAALVLEKPFDLDDLERAIKSFA